MGAALIVGIILVIVFVVADAKEQVQHPRQYTTMRCQTCGAEARVYGSSWDAHGAETSARSAENDGPLVYFFGVLPTETYNLVGLRH